MSRLRKIIIAYDISRNKTRRMVHNILKSWRIGGQKSVHEAYLDSNQAQELFIQISRKLNPKTDSLMMAWIESHRKILFRGLGKESVENNLFHIR
ncbi:CRISPR-associated endonuclease Cas2 [Desulfonema limicola]|uniref:CRISPR-associated endoribonuclease Cas2 n=1 Tax=Desulfonema limicola TaxID=45656 RepID=A0A975BA31_9BACT|nr:CRISPR-associated endonuclease Cas2 [Desulfonema limicola]QTA81766.1 CRISPR-associated endonuclease Cas2 [Desulfonema limicola]